MIKLFKMISGEEVVTEMVVHLDSEQKEHYTFHKPYSLVPMNAMNGEMQIALLPWIMADPNAIITVDTATVMGEIRTVPSRLEAQYLEKTSGIQLAQAMPVA